MKKKIIALTLASIMSFTLIGCSKNNTTDNSLRIGMVTDSGTIDDKSFNQGTWEGIKKIADEQSLESTYLKPVGQSNSEYLNEITNLYDSNYRFIVTPGYKFENSVYEAQNRYPDAKFVLIDGTPNDGNGNNKVGDNTVSIFFAEHEAGFIAGVATALKLQDGKVGFIGGPQVPAVLKYDSGFRQGIIYANETYGTNIQLDSENFIYEGTFTNAAAGKQIAASMYDRGVKAIFIAAGTTGVGAIDEAKTRAINGDEVWIVGVDIDQYEDGVYADGKSVMLTSAIKKLSQASYDMILNEINGTFPGGETIMFNIKNDGVGIPKTNPNLNDDIADKINEVVQKIKNDGIKIRSEQ